MPLLKTRVPLLAVKCVCVWKRQPGDLVILFCVKPEGSPPKREREKRLHRSLNFTVEACEGLCVGEGGSS